MKSIFVLAALASGILADFDQVSKPFRLFLVSDNSTLNGQSLGACHQGAAIEGLCPSGLTHDNDTTTYDTFYQTTSSAPPTSIPDNDAFGPLWWNLTIAGNITTPSSLKFSQNVMSDVVDINFFPGNSSYSTVTFNSGGCMYLLNYQDDTVSPPQYLSPPRKTENWYICLTQWTGYLKEVLTWKVGTVGVPQNPSCQKVQVVREFV